MESSSLIVLAVALVVVTVLSVVVLAWLHWQEHGANRRSQQRSQEELMEALRLIGAMRLSESGIAGSQIASQIVNSDSSSRSPQEAAMRDFLGTPVPSFVDEEMVAG